MNNVIELSQQHRTPGLDPNLRVAIVHDWLVVYGGAERVLEHMLDMFPNADLFSLIDKVPAEQRHFMRGKQPKTSLLQNIPGIARHYPKFLPLMPLAIEQFDFNDYDLVLSSSYCVAKGVLCGPNQVHVSYCHSPMRYAWDHQQEYLEQLNMQRGVKSWLVRALLHRMRAWDGRSNNTVDQFVANSEFVRARIRKFYGRDSSLVYPPIDTNVFQLNAAKEDFYMAAGRFVPFKRLDIAVRAFTEMPDKKLVMLGDGPEMEKLKALAGPNVEFLGFQPPAVMQDYLSRAKAFLFPSEEDFGIVPVEAQACGTPVIAFASGGALETVIPVSEQTPADSATGVWFNEQTPASLKAAVHQLEIVADEWDPIFIAAHAASFSPDTFKAQLRKEIEQAVASRPYQGRSIARPCKSTQADDAQVRAITYVSGVPITTPGAVRQQLEAAKPEQQLVIAAVDATQLQNAEDDRDYQFLLNQSDAVLQINTGIGQPQDDCQGLLAELLADDPAAVFSATDNHQQQKHWWPSLPSMHYVPFPNHAQQEQPERPEQEQQLQQALLKTGAKTLVIAHDHAAALAWALAHARDLPCQRIIILPGTRRAKANRWLSSLRLPGLSRLTPNAWWRRQRVRAFLKRQLDILGSAAALIGLAPLLLLTAAAVRLESPGPIIFKQTRVGARGRPFTMFKFRSMYTDAEARLAALQTQNQSAGGVIFKMRNDPRVTRVGSFIRRYSIDELPQFLNVLLGDMSLVGPRPALPNEVSQYSHEQRKRLQTRPGITCLWQISGRSNLTFQQQVELDIDYLASQNVVHDVSILAKTVPAVLKGDGAY